MLQIFHKREQTNMTDGQTDKEEKKENKHEGPQIDGKKEQQQPMSVELE